ncbi:MAG TPA: aminoglycoside 3-N-acetyltransferase [Actinomycetota bacterium]
MPGSRVPSDKRPVTRSELVRALRSLGVRPGSVLMVHTRMSAIGWVVGGSETVVGALLESVGPDGTLMAYAGWEENPYHLPEWPDDWQRAYLDELPPFVASLSEARHDHGRVAERLRTWPGAHRSPHPEANVVAVGPRAEWLCLEHEAVDAPSTPLSKLVEAEGQVLMLGAPLSTLTLLHHAEAVAEVPDKRRVSYRMPVLEDGRTVWRTFEDIETSDPGAFPYADVVGDEDAFEVIGQGALAAGCGITGKVGDAVSHLFEARRLLAFSVGWLEARFGLGG